MPENNVTAKQCHEYRGEIYDSIFPRWTLLSLGGAILTVLVFLFVATQENSEAASDAMKKAEIVEVKMGHLKEGQERIEGRLEQQYLILETIRDKQ